MQSDEDNLSISYIILPDSSRTVQLRINLFADIAYCQELQEIISVLKKMPS